MKFLNLPWGPNGSAKGDITKTAPDLEPEEPTLAPEEYAFLKLLMDANFPGRKFEAFFNRDDDKLSFIILVNMMQVYCSYTLDIKDINNLSRNITSYIERAKGHAMGANSIGDDIAVRFIDHIDPKTDLKTYTKVASQEI